MIRLYLTDVMCAKLSSRLNQMGVYQTDNLLLFIEAAIWRIRCGLPWRDLPSEFGPWKTVYNRFNEWCKSGLWEEIFLSLRTDPDFEWVFVDGTYIKAHQHSAGSGENETTKTIGLSRGGLTTKIHMACDAHGNPILFNLTGGNCHDTTQLPTLLAGLANAESVICDKGYDSESNRVLIRASGAVPHIPRRKGKKKDDQDFDREIYKSRHLVENLFARLKHFRGIATRFDKLSRNYSSVVAIGCLVIWLKL